MSQYRVVIDLYSPGENKSQKRANKSGFLDVRDRSLYHLEMPANALRSGPAADTYTYAGPHIIEFVLGDDKLVFCALEDEHTPGFIWLGENPGEIMDITTGKDGKSIVIINKHSTPRHLTNHTCGHWHYQLFAKNAHDDIYGIPWTSCNGRGSSNPSIKNV